MSQLVEGFRLSPQQKKLWLLRQTSPSYGAQCAIKIMGHVDVPQLWRALQEVVHKHDILKTGYYRPAGITLPIQYIEDALQPSWLIIDMRETGDQEHEKLINKFFELERLQANSYEKALPVLARLFIVSCDLHVLLLTLPVLNADAVSLKTLLQEISWFYMSSGSDSVRADQNMQYIQFSEWQNELLETDDEDVKQGNRYWQEQTRETSPFLRLPTEKASAEVQTFTNHLVSVSYPGMVENIERLLQQYSTTPNVFLFTCWMLLLYRLSGVDDFAIGMAFDGRKYEELRSVIGLCSTYLPIRGHLKANMSFLSLLKQLHTKIDDASARQEYFAKKPNIEETGVAIDFPFLFDFNEQSVICHGEVSFAISQQYICYEACKARLSCIYQEDTLTTEILYNADVFSIEAIQLLSAQFGILLQSVLEQPESPIRALRILSEYERELFSRLNNTRIDYPEDTCFHSLFEEQVAREPHNVAVIYKDKELSYVELNRRANQLAHYLLRLGVHPGECVGLYLERSFDMVIGLLGILKAGGAYVPLAAANPKERLAFITQDARIEIVVTHQSLCNALPAMKFVCMDGDNEIIARMPSTDIHYNLPGTNLAYIIYTSGSTGQPKGVMVQHRSLINYLSWCIKTYAVKEGRGSLVHSSLGFDLTVTSLLSPLLVGQKVQLLPEEESLEGLANTLKSGRNFSLVKITPAHLDLLTQLLSPGDLKECIRGLIVGGEALQEEQLAFWRAHAPGTRLFNEYGPTETVVGCSAYELPALACMSSPVPIGTPIDNTQIYVLDETLQQMPLGIVGDIYVGGDGVAAGYLHRPDLTAEKFLPDPFSSKPGSRLYQTGDMARYLLDGRLEYVGRSDTQVKLHGFRVELGEIDTTLREHFGIANAVTVLRDDTTGEKRLIAYVVPRSETMPVISRMLNFIQEGRIDKEALYELPNGLVAVHHHKSETDQTYQEIFVDDVYAKKGFHLSDDHPCIFDVGANIGLFTLYAGTKWKNASIYAFEPIPAICNILQANVGLYGLNARVFACGLSRAASHATFTYYPHCSVISGLFANPVEDRHVIKKYLSNQQISDMQESDASNSLLDPMLEDRLSTEYLVCPVTTISSVIKENNVDCIDLLKIDVEKSELDVLAGIQDEDWPKIKQIVIEVHNIDNRLDTIVTLLRNKEYSVSIECDDLLSGTGLYNVYAVQHSLADHKQGKSYSDVTPDSNHPRAQISLFTDDIQHFLKERLPDYMVPSHIILLASLPLTTNGKVNRRELPLPQKNWRDEKEYVEPRTPVEKDLADIWAKMLRLEKVGIHENFFALGGDSILSIQVISRAQRKGIRLTTKQLFQYQTIAELSQVAEASILSAVKQDRISGVVPLTPVQEWFFQQNIIEPYHFNQAFLFEIPASLDANKLEQALRIAIQHHGAFQLRFTAEHDRWKQFLGDMATSVHVTREDYSMVAIDEQKKVIEARAAQLHMTLDFTQGPVVGASIMYLGANQPGRLLIIIHHLVIDGVSWRILLEDCGIAYEKLCQGQTPQLPQETTPFQVWAWQLAEYANSIKVRQEIDYWVNMLEKENYKLPEDYTGERKNIEETTEVIAFSLDPTETHALLQEIPKRFRTYIDEVLLAALVQTFTAWTGRSALLLNLESHGREEIIEGIDLSRATGWFTSIYPIWLDLTGTENVEEALQAIKEQLRAIPQHGIGYGLLRYMSQDSRITRRLQAFPRPQLSFNYLGQFDQMFSEFSFFKPASESTGRFRSLQAKREHMIEVNSLVINEQMHIYWAYSNKIHQGSTIDRLARSYLDALRNFIVESRSQQTRVYTPLDFSKAGLDQQALNQFLRRVDHNNKRTNS